MPSEPTARQGLPQDRTAFERSEEAGHPEWTVLSQDHLMLRMRHPKFPAWAIEAIFEVYTEDHVLASLKVFPASGWAQPGGLTHEVWRTVGLGDLWTKARRYISQRDVAGPLGVDPSLFTKAKARGRKGRSDLDYARLAARYVELLKSDGPVIPPLAEEFHLAEGTIRQLLWEARNRGLLSRSGAGLAGGELTEKARRVLDGAH